MLPWYLRPCRAEGLHFSAYRHSLLLVSICLLLFLSPSTIVFTACFECPALCSSRVYIFFLRPHESLVLLFPLPTTAATASLAFMMLVSDIPLYTSHTLSKQLQWFQNQISLITLMKKCYKTWFCLEDTHFPPKSFYSNYCLWVNVCHVYYSNPNLVLYLSMSLPSNDDTIVTYTEQGWYVLYICLVWISDLLIKNSYGLATSEFFGLY